MSYSSRRKENQVRNYSHENQALDEISKEAEARLAAKRAARFQAREMRQKELSRHNSINRPATDASPLKPLKIAQQPNNEDGGGSAENDQEDSGDDCSQGSSSTDASNSNANANSEESRRFNDLSPPIRVPLINGVNNLSPQGDLNLPNCRPDSLPQRRNSNHNNNGHNHQHYPDNQVTQAQNGHCDESSTTELLQRLQEVEELYKIAMMSNAQLSNELDSLKYQVDLLVDDFDDLELKNSQIERDKKRQHKELLLLRKDHEVATDELARAKEQIQKRDQLIQNSDMVILDVDGQLSLTSPNKLPSHNNCDRADQTDHSSTPKYYRRPYAKQKGDADSENIPQVLITKSTLKILKEFAELHETPDSLDANLKKLIDARLGLEDTICDLKQQLHEQVVMNERNAELLSKASSASASDIERVWSPEDGKTFTNSNGFRDKETQTNDIDIKETRRKLLEYEYKLQRYEQELSTMAANLERAEANCLRQKNGREAVEASEAEIKSENRRLKRELREVTQNVTELTTKVGHLERRLEKMRASRLNAVITGNS